MKKYFLVLTISVLCSCKEDTNKSTNSEVATPLSCRGVYSIRDAKGDLKKFNQYWLASANACLTDNVALSQWEKTSEAWAKNNVHCTPQSQFVSRALIASNNFYSYRDGNVYLDLNSSTGVFRRVVLGQDKNGGLVFTRSQGCFYQRTGAGVDVGFGNQLLLDTNSAKFATSEYFDPMEIFRYDETTTTMNMTRFDSSADWDFKFCPYFRTPWEFCSLLRDGNIMYWPTNLTNTQQTDLLNEALLIRKQFNYSIIVSPAFESVWNSVDKTRLELSRDDWKYSTIALPDVPWFIDGAWRDYVMNMRLTMPNVNSNIMLPICYKGSQTVTLSNGNTGKVYGEICYDNSGAYSFTQ